MAKVRRVALWVVAVLVIMGALWVTGSLGPVSRWMVRYMPPEVWSALGTWIAVAVAIVTVAHRRSICQRSGGRSATNTRRAGTTERRFLQRAERRRSADPRNRHAQLRHHTGLQRQGRGFTASQVDAESPDSRQDRRCIDPRFPDPCAGPGVANRVGFRGDSQALPRQAPTAVERRNHHAIRI